MPGFMTHYVFGKSVIDEMDLDDKSIARHPKVFNTGLQGPDAFFYFAPCYSMKGGNPGSRIHNKDAGILIRNMLISETLIKDRKQREICRAYIYGFIGHYILDVMVHPYVYSALGKRDESGLQNLGRHFLLEHDIDILSCNSFCEKKLKNTRLDRFINITGNEKKIIAAFLSYNVEKTYSKIRMPYLCYYGAVALQIASCRFLSDRTGIKCAVTRLLERALLKCSYISALFTSTKQMNITDAANLNNDLWKINAGTDDEEYSNKSVPDLIEDARLVYMNALMLARDFFAAAALKGRYGAKYDKRYARSLDDVCRYLGNKSLHTGM